MQHLNTDTTDPDLSNIGPLQHLQYFAAQNTQGVSLCIPIWNMYFLPEQ